MYVKTLRELINVQSLKLTKHLQIV